PAVGGPGGLPVTRREPGPAGDRRARIASGGDAVDPAAVDPGHRVVRAVGLEVRKLARVPVAGADDAPGQPGGRGRFVAQAPAQLEQVPVGLHVVAAAAGRHHVVPGVLPPAAARDDVVDAGRDAAAVHAAAPVAGEQGAAGERNGPPVGHPDETLEPDHAGGGDGDGGAVQVGAGLLEAHGLVLEDEDERAAERYDT